MYQREVTVPNPAGLHARPASDFVKLAASFASAVTVGRTGEPGRDAKSIVTLLSLGMEQGETVLISADGDDEVRAVDSLAAFVSGLTD